MRLLLSSFEKMEPDDCDPCFMLTCRCRSRYRMHEDRKLQLHRFHRVLAVDCQRDRCVCFFVFPILPHLPSAIPPRIREQLADDRTLTVIVGLTLLRAWKHRMSPLPSPLPIILAQKGYGLTCLIYVDRQTQSALLVRMYRDGNSILPFPLLCDADTNVGLLYYVYLLGLSPTDLITSLAIL